MNLEDEIAQLPDYEESRQTKYKRDPPVEKELTTLKRTRQLVVAQTDILLEFVHEISKRSTQQRIHTATHQQGTLLDTEDYIDYCITFDPPVDKQNLYGGIIAASIGGKRLEWPLIPKLPFQETVFGTHKYLVFPTHQYELVDNHCILRLYFRLSNNALMRKSAQDIWLALEKDLEPLFFVRYFDKRYHGLDWVPPDLDLGEPGIDISPQDVPQRTPLWFKLRGQVSGSKAYKLLGYFPDSKEFTLFQRGRMRFGAMYEHLALALYLKNQQQISFYEKGWVPMPVSLGLPSSWGASPDGLVCDPHMTWNKVPDIELQQLGHLRNEIDITRGALEIKCSNSSSGIAPRGYYLVQMCVEMMALNVAWADLVLLHRSSEYDSSTGSYARRYSVSVCRYYRHFNTEKLLCQLLKEALSSPQQDLHKQPRFKKMRQYFDRKAKEQLQVVSLDVDLDLVQHFEEAFNKTEFEHADFPTREKVLCNVWDQIEDQLADLRHLENTSLLNGILNIQRRLTELAQSILI